MKLVEITEQQFNQFRKTYPYQNFWQSSEMCRFRKEKTPSWDYTYIGYEDDNGELKVVTALSHIQTFRQYKTFMCQRGFMMDYSDTALLDSFLGDLVKYLSEHHCLSMTIDPYVEYQKRDKDGVPYGEKRDDIVSIFEKHGFSHQGFRETFDVDFEPRFMSILPLKDKTKEELSSSFNAQTRQNINNTDKEGIKIRQLELDEMDKLEKMVSLTGGKRDFYSPGADYYQHFSEVFGEKMKAYYAYLDVKDYIERYQEVIEREEAKIKEIGEGELSKKQQSRKNQSEQLITSAKKRVAEGEELLKEVGEELPLAAAMFIYTDYEVVYLFSGSDDNYKHFKAPYAIQWKIIQEAKDLGVDRYNFYGISGTFTEEADDYGVYLFKKGFDADVIELLGDFQYIGDKKTYQLLQTLRKVKHTFKK